MLPKMDGITILKRLRNEKIYTPVLLLTARDGVVDRVQGLDMGADDYLCKPFNMQELLARIRAIIRRNNEKVNGLNITVGATTLSMSSLTVTYKDKSETLSPKEAQILEMLMLNAGVSISASRIIEKIWGYESDAEDGTVQVQMSLLRKKISNLGADINIRTIRSVGYILEH